MYITLVFTMTISHDASTCTCRIQVNRLPLIGYFPDKIMKYSLGQLNIDMVREIIYSIYYVIDTVYHVV